MSDHLPCTSSTTPTVGLVRFEGDVPSEPYIRYQLARMSRFRCLLITASEMGLWTRLTAPLFSLVRMRSDSRHIALVHTHFGPDAMYGHVIAKRARVPHVVSVHGYDVCYRWYQYLRLLRPRFIAYAVRRGGVLGQADLLLCCSDYLRRRVIALDVDPTKVAVHHLGVDMQQIEAARESRKMPPRETPHIVCVGRLVPIKGHELILRALPDIVRVLPNVRLTLIGDGPLRRRLRKVAGDGSVQQIVTFTGRLDHASTLRLMAEASVVVLLTGMSVSALNNVYVAIALAILSSLDRLGGQVAKARLGGRRCAGASPGLAVDLAPH